MFFIGSISLCSVDKEILDQLYTDGDTWNTCVLFLLVLCVWLERIIVH
jgi:hypothetical protein